MVAQGVAVVEVSVDFLQELILGTGQCWLRDIQSSQAKWAKADGCFGV